MARTLFDQVKIKVLEGLWPAEIRKQLPSASERTVQQYCHTIMRQLTDKERARVELIRNARPKPGSGGKHFFERVVVSQQHALLGSKIYYFRRCLDLGVQDFCRIYEFSNRVQLSAMEQGYHDFTLTEIMRLCEIMQFSVEQLMGILQDDLSAQRLLPNHPGASSAA